VPRQRQTLQDWTLNLHSADVPEPSAFAFLGGGLAGLAMLGRKRRV